MSVDLSLIQKELRYSAGEDERLETENLRAFFLY